jgi:hypothetical protein
MRRVRQGRVAVLATSLVIAGIAFAIPVADAGDEIVLSFGLTSGNPALGGTLNNPRGVAVNTTGAGGVPAGTVYVADGSNNRIARFGEAGGFVSAWGHDVVQAGAPGDAGATFEICAVAANCKSGTNNLAGGAFLSPRGVAVNQVTGDVYTLDGNTRVQQFTATGEFMRAWGAGVVVGGAMGTGTLANSTTTITGVVTTSKAFAVGQAITGAGIQPGTTITAVGAASGGTITLSKPTTASAAGTGVALSVAAGVGNVATNEQQTVTLGSNTTGGTFTLTFTTPNPSNTTGTTAAIAHDASAATVQAALEALPNIGVGDVAVTGAAGGPWTVTFQGTRFADTDVNQLTASATGLTVGSEAATVTSATVVIGASAAEVCVAVVECIAAKSLSGAGQFATSNVMTQLAVGPSGHVYVPEAGNARVQEFTASGEFVRMWGWDVTQPADVTPSFEICTVAAQCKAGVAGPGSPSQFAAGHPTGVAVDSMGNVYAADGGNGRIAKFSSTGGYLTAFAPGGSNVPATTGYNLAVDRSDDHLLVGSRFDPPQRRIEELSSTGALLDTHLASGVPDIGGLGVNSSSGSIYASVTTDDSRVVMVGPESPPEATVAPVTNVGATTATFNGTVTPPGGGLSARYRFEYSTDGAGWTGVPIADVNVGSAPAPVSVHQDVTGLDPNTHYLVRLVARTGSAAGSIDTSSTVDFTTDVAPPAVTQVDAGHVGRTTASLRAKIDPQNLATDYRFEWGETAAYGQQAPSSPPPLSGGTPQAVQAPLAGLQPNRTYHFRVVATNAVDSYEGPDRVFRTLNGSGLPDNRAYELVSSAGKTRAGNWPDTGVQVQAAADGQSIFWPAAGGTSEMTARGSDAWLSSQPTPGEYRYLSDDLSCAVLASAEPLTSDAPAAVTDAGGRNLFRRGADGSHAVLSNLAPLNATDAGIDDRYASVSGSGDCGHVVFETEYVYPGIDASGLYEWDHGVLRNVGVLPDGGIAVGATLGALGGQNAWNAVSEDGSRIFFSATSNSGADTSRQAVFVREDGATTVKASASETATPNRGAVYQLASKTGSRVLFLANYGLTSPTSAGPTDGNCALALPLSCDLYAYDVETGDLTDLSVDTAGAGGARVAGVLGASDDASYVYFAARGQLVAGKGRTVAENFAAGSHNIYLDYEGQRSFVGLLRAADLAGGAQRNGALVARSTAPSSPWASRVTPDGRHLLFASSAKVTGYDSGGVTEAYLYSADADETVCVSCRYDGQPSVGVSAGGDSSTAPLASDGSTGHDNPLHPPRTLSADGGRVFFEKPDALAAGAVSGQDNVYQWKDGQIALLASSAAATPANRTRFEDASDSGDDVFISTRDAFLPEDVDGSLDVYGVRVDGGLPGGLIPLPPVFPPPGADAPPPRRAAFVVKGLSRLQRARLVAGKRVGLRVRVGRAGRVSVKGVARIGGARVTVLSGARRAARARTVKVPIALTKAARRRIAKAGSLKVRLTVTFRASKKVRTIVLRRAKPVKRR